MNKKNILLLLIFIFGTNSTKPAYYHLPQDNKILYPIIITGVLAGGAAIHAAYKKIKPKVLEKLEQYNQNCDQKLIQEMQQYIEHFHSKYKKEYLMIYNVAGDRDLYDRPVIEELASFFVKNKINYFTYFADLAQDRQELKNKIQRLQNRFDKRYERLQNTDTLIAFNSIFEAAIQYSYQIERIYYLLESEFAYFSLVQMQADYSNYIELYIQYKAGLISCCEYENQFHSIISSGKSDNVKFPYLEVERKLVKAIDDLEKAISSLNHMYDAYAICSGSSIDKQMSIESLLRESNKTIDILRNIHNDIKALPQYYYELKNEQELTLQDQREYQEQLDAWRHERELYEQKQQVPEHQKLSDIIIPIITETKIEEPVVQPKKSILDDPERFLNELDLY